MNQYKNFRVFKGKVSFLLDKKAIFILISLLVMTGIVFIVSTGLGDMKLSPLTVLSVFFGGGSDLEQLVVQSFRLPRIIVALMVGIALAVAGGILQGMIRNPLASPDILGITGGASVAVVSFLTLFSDTNNSLTVSIKWLPLAAFVGAVVIALLVYFLAWKNGVSPIRIVLIGIGISALMQALTTLMMIMGPIYRASQANIWITGTVYGSSWNNVAILVPWTIIFIAIAFFMVKNINILELGDDIATGIGGRIQRHRFVLLLISTALVGGAVAFAGGIGFSV